MPKKRINFKSLAYCLLVILLASLAVAWKDVDIKDLASLNKEKEQQRAEEEEKIKEELSGLGIGPLRIIQKMGSALMEAEGMKCTMDIWMQHPSFHTNIHLDQQFESLDKVHITGRTSLSLLVPGTKFSTSEWLQSYTFGGSSYVFNFAKNHWEKEKLKLSKEKELEKVEYGLFQSLATPKSDLVLEDTVSIVSLQKYKGRDCFVLKFNLDPEFFKKWGLTGAIDNYKAWVDRQNFYPYIFRLEGSIGDSKFLQIVEYSDFNSLITLKIPTEITEEAQEENKQLLQQTQDIIEKIKELRGGSPPEGMKVDFITRKKIRSYIKEKIAKDYSQQEVFAQEIILKWLNLVPAQFDYKQMLIDSATSSIAGFYEPEEKSFYISEWIPDYLAEAVLSHELMHAFQDNKIDLGKYLKEQKYLDRIYARKFLIEGEATAVMLQLVYNKQNKNFQDEDDLLTLIKDRMSANESASSSGSYHNLNYSGYAYGARFVQRAINNFGWKNLDKLYEDVPQTMKEIMHPDVYFDKNSDVIIKDLPGPALKDWNKFYQNSIGEFFVKMWLDKFMEKDEAEILSETLMNDKILLYDCKGKKEPSKIFLTEWDSAESAKKFVDAYCKLQDKRLKNKAKKEEKKNYTLWLSQNGNDLITSNQKYVLIASASSLNQEETDTLLSVLGDYQVN